MQIPLTQVKGVGPALAKDLAAHGIKSVEDLAAAPLGKLSAVHGFSDTRAAQVKMAAADLIRSQGGAPEPVLAAEPATEAPEGETEKTAKKEKKEKEGEESLQGQEKGQEEGKKEIQEIGRSALPAAVVLQAGRG